MNAVFKMRRRLVTRAARVSVAVIGFALVTACATGPGASSASLPADGKFAHGRIAGKQYLTTVATGAASSSGPSVGLGAGGIGGSGISGMGLGAGVGFDITSLFEKRAEQTAKVYRYSVRMQDGARREIDSTLELPEGACVTTIDSAQPGYPRLMPANEC